MAKYRGDRAMLCARCGERIGDDALVTYKFTNVTRKPKIAWHMRCSDIDEVWNVIRRDGLDAAITIVESRGAGRVKWVPSRARKGGGDGC